MNQSNQGLPLQHFKTVKLMTIRNGLKQTISTSGGLELSQMVLEADSEQYASENVRSLRR